MSKTSTITIDGLGHSGEGIGSLEGLRTFVDGALPGETVEISLTSKKKTYAKGSLQQILTPSPDRVQPPCNVFGKCGGCQLQHLSYQAQLEAKRQRVKDALQRIGGIDTTVEPCIASPSPYDYRNKIQVPVAVTENDVKLGLFAKGSHEIVPFDTCHIHCTHGEQVFQTIRPLITTQHRPLKYLLIKTAIHHKHSLVVLVVDQPNTAEIKKLARTISEQCRSVAGVLESVKPSGNRILGNAFSLLAGQATMRESLLGHTFHVSASAFFQVNTLQAEQLYSCALSRANLTPTTHLVDAYCGVGTLAILAAKQVERVTGIEVVPGAIDDAKKNATLNQATNTSFLCGLTEKILPTIDRADVILLNPPRKGCDESLLATLNVPHLVYISCDPATLARDLARLRAKGYHLNRVQPFDMFPQTAHVETVVDLSSET